VLVSTRQTSTLKGGVQPLKSIDFCDVYRTRRDPPTVPLKRLRIAGFRNLGDQELEFPAEGVAIVGRNAQGKSNLLEAIYYLETLRSFRGAREDQLVGFGRDVFRIEGVLEGDPQGVTSVAAAFQRRGREKKVTVDGAEVERLAQGIGHLSAVLFSPLDTGLVSEGPAERRRYLDIVLSLNRPGYLEALQRYRKILAQRNAALKERAEPGVVRVWDEPLSRLGGEVMEARASWCADWVERFGDYYARVSGNVRALLRYQPAVGSSVERPDGESIGDPGVWRGALAEGLTRSWDRDARLGTTSVGPHRDDMVLSLDSDRGDLDLRDFGSGGQRRTAALALRLVEADTIRAARGKEPLVLMDDAFAELDADRSQRILELMESEEKGQVIVTAPKEADIRFRSGQLERWTIESGAIRPV
jgi:DNA replication and repair protein RecF